jgi:hypothetical protein
MSSANFDHTQSLKSLVLRSDILMRALRSVRSLQLKSWAIGAGAIRALVWDELHGFVMSTPIQDLDVIFYDVDAVYPRFEVELMARLQVLLPEVNWDVVNQATVHQWLREHGTADAEPFQSLTQGIASWPEFATCVGVYLDDTDQLHIIAPHGLDDLFALRVRHNSCGVSYEVFCERVFKKQFQRRWPQLTVVWNDKL